MALGLHGGMPLLLGLWGVVGAVAIYGVRHLRREPTPTAPMHRGEPGGEQALAILRVRFARGEHGQAEYEEQRRMLAETPRAWPDLT